MVLFKTSTFVILLACEVTTVSGPRILQAAGTTASLAWNIHRPYNFILNSVECYRTKTIGGLRTTIAKLQPDHTFGKTARIERNSRIVVQKTGERYTITINNLKEIDAATYSCFVTCISGKPFYYEEQLKLIVEGEGRNYYYFELL